MKALDPCNHGTKALDDKSQGLSPETFNRFPEFPLEIQRLVWHHAHLGCRVIEACVEHLGELIEPVRYGSVETSNLIFRERFPKFSEKRSISENSLLFACHESRAVALESYDVCLSSNPDPVVQFQRRQTALNPVQVLSSDEIVSRGIRFIPSQDTIYFPFSSDMKLALHHLKETEFRCSNIRSVALDSNFVNEYWVWYNLFVGTKEYNEQPLLKGIEEIVVVEAEDFVHDDQRWLSLMDKVQWMVSLKRTRLEKVPELRFMTKQELFNWPKHKITCIFLDPAYPELDNKKTVSL